MTFEELQKANQAMELVDIKGKDYATVNQRVKAFRMVYPMGSIETEIVSLVDGIIVVKAIIKDEDGKILATGHAREKESSSFINKTSFVENGETSAIGRALGFCGFGIDTSIASYEEVGNAMANQNQATFAQRALIKKAVRESGIGEDRFLANWNKRYGVKKIDDLTEEQADEIISNINASQAQSFIREE